MKIWTNAGQVAAGLTRDSLKIRAQISALVVHHGQLLRTRVMANASGRPGPNIVTGDYRRSISMQVEEGSLSTTVYVGTNAPQGRRLEFGFHGIDSLGRRYNQPPYPHFGPAVDQITPGLVRDVELAVRSLDA